MFSKRNRGYYAVAGEDMNFVFEWQELYLTSERSERVMFFLLYKRANDAVFDDFPRISDDFPKLLRRPDERFLALNYFQLF